MENTKSIRYRGLDILKCIGAFMIVVIHIPFPGIAGGYLTAFSRVAVPIFFMISGFFYQNIIDAGREKEQLRKVFALYIKANTGYLIWQCLVTKSFLMADTFTVKNMFNFLVFNDSPFGFHLWYLGALLYVLFIMYLAGKYRLVNLLCILSPVLLLVDLAFGKYSLLLFGREFPVEAVRNFLFVGIPYFCIGMFIWRSMQSGRTVKLSVLAVLSILFYVLTVIERALLVKAGLNATRDQYICTTLLSVTIFRLFAGWGRDRSLTKGEEIAAMIGKVYSTGIYIIHPVIITVVTKIAASLGIYSIYRSIAAFIIFMISVIITASFYKCVKLARGLHKKVSTPL